MALPCLAATDQETPIPHAALLAAFQGAAQALIGHTVAVTWSWQGDRSARVEWHGRILNISNASVRIFYWKQDGMPELKRGAPGIEVEMPRANVEYWRVQVTAPIAVSAAELEEAMRAPGEQHNSMSLESWILHDVTTWANLSEPTGTVAEIIKNRIAMLAQVNLTSSARRKNALQALFSWIDSSKALDNWLEMPPMVALGNSLVSTLRLTVAEESQGVSPEAVARSIAKEDDSDPVGQAIAKLASDKTKKKGAFRSCSYCHKKGHTEEYCFAKRKGDPPPKNGGGTATKEKKN
jgi:hypothetical protein